jgi:hypothetical protein
MAERESAERLSKRTSFSLANHLRGALNQSQAVPENPGIVDGYNGGYKKENKCPLGNGCGSLTAVYARRPQAVTQTGMA